MKLYGIIGNPLGHSFSPGFFNKKFREEGYTDCEYRPFQLRNIDEFPKLIEDHPDLVGLNVTSPFKESIFKYIDQVDRDAKLIGSVNTLKIQKSEHGRKIFGFNTDTYGFEQSLKPYIKGLKTKALIIGTGGASKAVAYVFKKLGIGCEVVTRRPLKANHIVYWAVNKQIMEDHLIIVNATPMGMHPGMPEFPDIPYHYITPNHILFDLVYNPPKTRFLEFGEKAGATTINGMKMFELQALKSWEIWNS